MVKSTRVKRIVLFASFMILSLSILAGSKIFFTDEEIQIGQMNDMLAAADVKNGHEISKGCTACHSFEKEGPKKVGPNLFGVVGAKIARREDFSYSSALREKRDRHWTIDELNEWLRDPTVYAPGTAMAFGGLLDPQDRMDLIAYMLTLRN